MACRKLKVKQPDGTFSYGFICGEFEHDLICRICGCFADKLCDYPIGNDKTCDSAMCKDCAVHIKMERFYILTDYKMMAPEFNPQTAGE